jgi:predicted ATPase
MAAILLERDPYLRALDDSLCQMEDGHGRVVLVSGEAGIGKTSLVEAFLQSQPAGVRVAYEQRLISPVGMSVTAPG